MFRVLLLLFCVGCGYRIEENYTEDSGPQRIAIPYVIGDEDGKLTAFLIKEVSASGRYLYDPHCSASC